VMGRTLQKARRELFAQQPLCAECAKAGRVSAAVQRDHIVPLSQGGRDVASNTQGLCAECHARKSEQERLAGYGRTVATPTPSNSDTASYTLC
jgi:5-methylcytosine-specific restriction enzyme A